MEQDKKEGVVAIIAALIVLFSAMWSAEVSLAVSVAALVGIGVWQMVGNKSGGAKGGLIEEQVKEKEEHKQKIMEMIDKRARVANEEVEKMLGVSAATVVRYFDELQKEGKIKQVGVTGRSVYYEKK